MRFVSGRANCNDLPLCLCCRTWPLGPVLNSYVTLSPHVANRDSHKTGQVVRDATIPKRHRRKITAEVWCRARHPHSPLWFAGKASSPRLLSYHRGRTVCTCVSAHHYGVHVAARAPNELFRDRSSSPHTTVHVDGALVDRREGAEKAARRGGEVFCCGEPGTASRPARLPTDQVHFPHG